MFYIKLLVARCTNVVKSHFPSYFRIYREDKDRFRFIKGMGMFDHGKVSYKLEFK